MDELPKDLRILLIKRGNARCMLPMEFKAMWDTTPYYVALQAINYLAALEVEKPGHTEMPVSTYNEMALSFPGALGVLDPEAVIGPQLTGHWEDMDFDVVGDTPKLRCPCCVLVLIDTNRN